MFAAPQHPAKAAVPIGRINSDGLVMQVEIEGAQAMWMPMGTPPKWREHALKLTDLATKTRLPYAAVAFAVKNTGTGKSVEMVLPPMWGGSGLHYSETSALAGDGIYSASLTIEAPTFAHAMVESAPFPGRSGLFLKTRTSQGSFLCLCR